jgi:hypothetical protein
MKFRIFRKAGLSPVMDKNLTSIQWLGSIIIPKINKREYYALVSFKHKRETIDTQHSMWGCGCND